MSAGKLALGPKFQSQMRRLGQVWEPGQHILVTGPTGSGKTALARRVVAERSRRGGFVCVFVGKLGEDETIVRDYLKEGFVRWKTWKKAPRKYEDKVLLWPDTSRLKTVPEMRAHQKEVFEHAFNQLARTGRWTLQIDEGLYTVDSQFLNLGNHVASLHQMGRSSSLSIVTLAQRPAHLPLVVYSSASHVFAGRLREEADRKRLAELGGKENSRELVAKISENDRHQFTWIPVAQDWRAETVEMTV
jgi:energy-coupling factor transporter ATP-binding protein EcfA2